MTSSRYRMLFSPLRLGPTVVRNRVVFSAHLTNYAEDGLPSEQHAAYYAARAAGGAGLIITEEHSTHPTDWPYEKLIHGFRPEVLPGYRRITEAVHAEGTPIFAQINHNGGQSSGMFSRLPVWAPSPVADPLFREVPKEVDELEIHEIVRSYAEVAERCVAGGFDGIELQCSHSSIVRAFLSPATNRRGDRYGGSLENRARLLLEIIGAVYEAVGPGTTLGVRICGDELVEGGTTIDEAVAIARLVEASGKVHYLNTSIGVATASLFMIEASMAVRPGYALFISSALRRAVDLPVVGVGRFKDPLQADKAIVEGHCDLVGVVRGQIADPDFVAKARAGAPEAIRLCLSCNQECVGRMGLNRWLGCIENPATGRERLGPPRRTTLARRVLVAGGGPGGLQAAIAAARRGHEVTVFERDDEVGGQVRFAASAPGRAEFGDLVRNQLAEALRLGVQVKTGTEVDPDLVLAERPDVVVVATGARSVRPWWAEAPGDEPGSDGPALPRLADVRDVLEGRASPAGRVLVVDEIGFHQATSVAELLADRGCAVEVVSPSMVVGQDLGVTLDMEHWWYRATAKGIAQHPDTLVTGLVAGGVTVTDLMTGEPGRRDADWVVVAAPEQPCDGLYLALRARAGAAGPAVHRVGDCLAPRRAHAAVVDGERVGAGL
ncbi:MAG TPA: mycofactocin system FadH/OYE family oxidoreductase 2 [Acidimicrobiales bacterium]|nr:mycofactocin system FadH/OYE family oxidoreductase 2 [Acidimicrobiales bacterium]